MELIRQANWQVMPWRSGQGETAEIAISPSGAKLEGGGFDWRLSVARMSEDARFSGFPGYDRILTVVEGGGLTLDAVPNDPCLEVPGLEVPALSPTAFPGERELIGRLKDGPVRNLNLILARGRVRARVRLHESRTEGGVLCGAAEAVLIMSLNEHPVSLYGGTRAEEYRLERLDVLLQRETMTGGYKLTMADTGPLSFILIEIFPASDVPGPTV